LKIQIIDQMATASIEDGLAPEDVATFHESREHYVSDQTRQLRIWHVRQIPNRGVVDDQYVRGVMGMVLPNQVQIDQKRIEIKEDHKLLKSWALTRVRGIFISLCQRYKVLAHGNKVDCWSNVRIACAQLVATNDEKAMQLQDYIQSGWWAKTPYQRVLENEYMSTRRIVYRPLLPSEEGKIMVNCIATVIRVKLNDIQNEIKRTCMQLAKAHTVSKFRRSKNASANSASVSASLLSSRLIRSSQDCSSSSSEFKCDGECSFVKQLREELSVVQQALDDTVNDYEDKISVSVDDL
jgi:hypothetical protein